MFQNIQMLFCYSTIQARMFNLFIILFDVCLFRMNPDDNIHDDYLLFNSNIIVKHMDGQCTSSK